MRRALLTLLALLLAAPLGAQQPAPAAGHEWRECLVPVVVVAPPPAPVSPVIQVPAGADLQAAINAAQPGDTLALAAGATYTGNFVLPAASGTGTLPILIVTANVLGLPATGTRVGPVHIAQLPTLRSPNSLPALRTSPGSAHWRFQGVQFVAGSTGDVVQLGDSTQTLAQVPSDLAFYQVIIRGDPQSKRGVQLNSASTTIKDSYIAGIHLVGQETQAIAGWNGPGPFRIENNTIEAGSIGILFGGAAPSITGLSPANITVERNTLTRPLSMKGAGYAVKNLFELKNATYVTVVGNIVENNWPDGQAGYAVVLTVRANSPSAPWSTIQHVRFEFNTVRHSAMAFNILGLDNQVANGAVYPSLPMDDVLIRNNLVYDIDRTVWTSATGTMGSGAFMAIDGAPRNLVVENNTGLANGNILALSGPQIPALVFRRNIVQKVVSPYQSYGVFGNAAGEGNPAFAAFAPDATFTDNVLAGATASVYSTKPGNFFPTVAVLWSGFTDSFAEDFTLIDTSPYLTLGADLEALAAAQAGQS